MTSYETSAIASSDEDDDELSIPDSIGLIITTSSPTPVDSLTTSFSSSFPNSLTHHHQHHHQHPHHHHPLLNRHLWRAPVIFAHCHVTSTPREYDPDSLHNLHSTSLDLISRGAVVVLTDVGFSSMQRDLSTRISVPVLCSAMVQLSTLNLVSTSGVGVVTLDRQLLSSWNLVAVGASPDTPVIGLPKSSLWRTPDPSTNSCSAAAASSSSSSLFSVMGREREKLLGDLVDVCRELIKHYGVDVVVLEDPKFAVFTAEIHEKLPTIRFFDVVTGVHWLYDGYRRVSGDSNYDAASPSTKAVGIPGAASGSRQRREVEVGEDEDEREEEDSSSVEDGETTLVSSRQPTPQFRDEVKVRF